MSFRIDADYLIEFNSFLLLLKKYDVASRRAFVAKRIEWVEVEAGQRIPEDTGERWSEMDVKAFLQAAMNAGWQMGLKPSQFNEKDERPHMDALKYHLEDMRRLVFKDAQ